VTAFHIVQDKTTWFVLTRPTAGIWRVEALPDSTEVTSVVHADMLPKPSIKASVHHRAGHFELTYAVKPLPGQSVSFAEVGKGGGGEIGRAREARGTIRFTPADGPRETRKIIALVQSNGTPRATVVVTRYKAPGMPRPARAKVRVSRRGPRLVIRWASVPGAASYQVRVRVSDGRSLLFLPSRSAHRQVSVAGVPRTAAATVSVQAVRTDGFVGPATLVRVSRAKARAEMARRGSRSGT
jgi:hypothetical protein